MSVNIFSPVLNDSEMRLAYIRGFNSVFYFVAALILYACIIELNNSRGLGVIGVLFFTVSPGLVHDAQMARPEAFLTFLMISYIYGCVVSYKRWLLGAVIAGLCLGLMISTKFTLAIMAVIYLVPVVVVRLNNIKNGEVGSVTVFLGAIFLGLFLGAPYAFMDVRGYFEGVGELRKQYYSLHLPHSYVSGGGTLLWQVEFYFIYYGAVFLSPVVVLLRNGRAGDFRCVKLSICFAAIVFFLLVATPSVFFERNLSPAIPLFIMATIFIYGWLPSGYFVRMLFTIILFVPLFFWCWHIRNVQSPGYGKMIDVVETNLVNELSPKKISHIMLGSNPESCGLIRQLDFSDETSSEIRKKYMDEGWGRVGQIISPFNILPTSTLHTYLAPNVYWLYKACL